MKIAIIGTGNVGTALATSSVRGGHDVRISGTSEEKAKKAAQETGAKPAGSNREAADGAELIIPAVWFTKMDEVLGDIGDRIAGTVLVDVTNPLKPDYSGLAFEGTSEAEQLQSRAPKARVVKAFNTLFASRQKDPKVGGVALDGLLAGDDEDAKAKVKELMRSMGLRPIDAGPLAMARHLEALGFLNISLNARNDLSWQNGWKYLGPDEL